MIQTRGPLKPDTTFDGGITYGKTVIYDAVGNVVAVDLPVRSSPADDRLYFVFWDGTNRMKRRVASGAYLLKALVAFANESENPVPIQVKFVINRNKGN